MQNKNKTLSLHPKIDKIKHITRFGAKLLVNALIITFGIKVLVVGALFLIPRKTVSAEIAPLNTKTLISLTNQERKKYKLASLKPNLLLTKAAADKAYNMITNDYFAHTAPDGKPFYKWIQEVDYNYQSAGENLAISFVREKDIISAWMHSRTHRDNILDPEYQDIGIATATGDFNGKTTTVVVQLFGQPLNNNLITSVAKLESQTLGASIGDFSSAAKRDLAPIYWLNKVNSGLNISLLIMVSLLSIILTEKIIFEIKGRT